MYESNEEQEVFLVNKLLGRTIGFICLIFAVLLSYKIYQNFSEHTFFATVFGIPTNILLYLIVWKCFTLNNTASESINRKGKLTLKKVADDEIDLPKHK